MSPSGCRQPPTVKTNCRTLNVTIFGRSPKRVHPHYFLLQKLLGPHPPEKQPLEGPTGPTFGSTLSTSTGEGSFGQPGRGGSCEVLDQNAWLCMLYM